MAAKRAPIAFLITALLLPCLAQKQPTKSTPSPAKPFDWGVFTIRLFPNSSRISFALVTSWIPGENHKGVMRYKMTALREKIDPPDAASALESVDRLFRRLNGCTITANLYDEDDFIVREIKVPFHLGTDDEQKAVGLVANSSVQMDIEEYRKLMTKPSSWNVAWDCPY